MKTCVFLVALLLVHPLVARTWTEVGSGRKIEADFVSGDASGVTVSVKGGQVFTIPLERLSPEDGVFVRESLRGEVTLGSVSEAKREDRFEAISIKGGDIPVSGVAHAALAVVDAAVRAFMAEKGMGAVTFALSKDGKVLHERAFGWADADLKTPLEPGVKMRVASMTKPVVQAAIRTLFTEEKLRPDALVFSVLDLGQYEEAKGCDERWQRITIEHLLDHKGGWDRGLSGDFTFNNDVSDSFQVKVNELTPEHVMRYGLGKKLDFDPGERYAYCNYGYILLVRVIEKVSGQKFMDYLHGTVCKVAEAPSFSLSASDARDRQAGEIWYCYHPEYTREVVPLPFRTEARDGAGVLACTAADYCRFLEHYTVLGNERRRGGRYRGSFSGSHPGVTAICSQREDGINYAIICNGRGAGKADWNGDLRKVVDAALESVVGELK